MPEVSVVMAAYNAMPYLPEAIESILSQTLRDFELIVVNDGSTDGTLDYLESIQDDRLKIVTQPNQGQQVAANHGISIAQAKYIGRMDADDIADPTRFEKQVAFLEQNPECGLVGSQIFRMGEAKTGLRSYFPTHHSEIYDDLIHNRHSMCNPAVLFRKSLFESIGGYWKHDISEDWDMFLRMGEVSELRNLNEPLLSYRFHGHSINGRRMIEAQLHNEYACELARRRRDGKEEITFEDFRRKHYSSRWPFSWMFHLDCHGVAQYRKAVAEMQNGHRLSGTARMGYAIACSPKRSLSRIARVLKKR